MLCNECGTRMVKVDRRYQMAELDEDATEGQMADYWASELSGDMGDWRERVVAYMCRRCGVRIEVISDSLKDYDLLIKRWHEKTRYGDYFEKYIFEYLAFNVYLRTHIDMTARDDRDAINHLKRRDDLKQQYMMMIENEQGPLLRDSWLKVIETLNRLPLRNSSRDFDNPELVTHWTRQDGSGPEIDNSQKGIVHSLTDWPNMVEYWYTIRNNLIHGGKDPTLERDIFLVEHAFITLNGYMKMIINTLNN